MQYKTIGGRLFKKSEVSSLGSYESFEMLKVSIRKIEQGIEAGLLANVYLEITEDFGSTYMAFIGYRPCSPEEIKTYEAQLSKIKEEQEQREREQFERLKKKFNP